MGSVTRETKGAKLESTQDLLFFAMWSALSTRPAC